MISINIKKEEQKEITLGNRDVILLKDKESGETIFGFIICIGNKCDVLMLEESDDSSIYSSGISKWNSGGYNNVTSLIESIKKDFSIKKLEPKDYEINIDIK